VSYAPAFFDTLYPASAENRDLGYVVLCTYPEGVYNEESGPINRQMFAWPSQREDIIAFCNSNQKIDVYTTTALFSEPMARAKNIVHQWAVAIDGEGMDLGRLLVEPTLIVETAPRQHQIYWITDEDSAQTALDSAKTISGHHRAHGADSGSWDAMTLLRVPGTTNTQEEFEVRLVRQGTPVSGEHLRSAYPAPVAVEYEDMPPRRVWFYSGSSVKESQQLFRIHKHIKDIAGRECETNEKEQILWNLLSAMSRCAVSKTTAMHIAWEAKCNPYKGTDEAEQNLWTELCRAYADPDNVAVTSTLMADQKADNPEQRALNQAEITSFLTDEEREIAIAYDDTFIDQYQAWASQQTDAPHQYHRVGAATILSLVLGEFGMCPTRTRINLALWFMLLGPTTWARKTTAMNLWVDLLADSEEGKFSYLLTSDATPEALIGSLMMRDGKSSLVHRDEVHGLFKEQEKKHYMSGFQELTTDLHNGTVRSKIRVGDGPLTDEDRKKRVRTNFVLFQCGTTEQVTKLLTTTDYENGHMARFLCAYANPSMPSAESMYMDLSGVSMEAGEDEERDALLAEIAAMRSFWSIDQGIHQGDLVKIPFEPDADKRWNAYQYKVLQDSQNTDMGAILSPTALRMGISTMKMAILLAMAERETTVNMRHLLKAIHMSEEWYASTLIIAGKIEASSWYEQQEQILAAIESRIDGITQSEVFSRFCNRMTTEEIEKAIKALEKRGDIVVKEEKKSIRLRRNHRR